MVTGHDLLDLSDLLEQTAGKGINVYTHGEMLPAHAYPKLKAHPHLAGHFGWSVAEPALGVSIFQWSDCCDDQLCSDSVGFVQRPIVYNASHRCTGGTRLRTNDFSEVIAAAKTLSPLRERKVRESTIGFHHKVILGLANEIVSAVKSGQLKHFYLIGGCDGAEAGRNYTPNWLSRHRRNPLF